MKYETLRLRRAAQHYEKHWKPRGAGIAYYPCYVVQRFDPINGSYKTPGTLANRFITALCPGRYTPLAKHEASDRFLQHVNLDTLRGCDHCILALAFAAAMAETGDL